MFNIRNKKITVMGLGLLGRGIGDVKFLVSEGAKVTVTDLKTRQQLRPSILELEKSGKTRKKADRRIYPIKYVLGKHRVEDFKSADYILKAAGVPLNSPYIKIAREKGIPIKMDDSWLGEICPCSIIGVTGTRGKTTTANLIYEILKINAKKGKKVYLGGNIRGMATLPLIKKIKPNDELVIELSSWQLQGWRDAKISPRIAVITNIFPDHLNYYPSMKEYVFDKKAIYENQGVDDFLVLNKEDKYADEFSREAKGHIVWFSKKDVPKNWRIKILGEHNLANIAAAIKVAEILEIPKNKIRKAVRDFQGVEGRLQFLKNYHGAKIYNDNNATTPEAVIAALKSFSEPIVLLAGGARKKVDYKELAKLIKKKVRFLILFKGGGSNDLIKELKKIKYNQGSVVVESMKEAIEVVKTILKSGDVFLLSPACASFGMFVNEYDRGDQFVKIIKDL